MVFVHIDRDVWIDELIVRFAERHVVASLKIGRSQAAGLAQLDANCSREHHHDCCLLCVCVGLCVFECVGWWKSCFMCEVFFLV